MARRRPACCQTVSLAPAQVYLEGRNLSHAFGKGEVRTTVLHEVTLRLRPSELVLVMGPSGSGKSTLLAALSCLMRPESGQVVALDEDLWQLSTAARKQFRQRHFGFIFQGYNLFPALTARQQLEIVLRWADATPANVARQRADAMLHVLGLGEKGHLRPAQLSGGEKQRVAIGRALIKEPEFIFADEPTSALDWKHGQKVVELLRAAATRGASIFVVSHDSRQCLMPIIILHLQDSRLDEQQHT